MWGDSGERLTSAVRRESVNWMLSRSPKPPSPLLRRAKSTPKIPRRKIGGLTQPLDDYDAREYVYVCARARAHSLGRGGHDRNRRFSWLTQPQVLGGACPLCPTQKPSILRHERPA